MKIRLADLSLLALFVVCLAALLLRTFAPGIFLKAHDGLGRTLECRATLLLGPEWGEASLRARAKTGDAAEAFAGLQGASIVSISGGETSVVAIVSLRAQETPGGDLSYAYYPLRPGAALEIEFPNYTLSGRIISIER